MSSYMVSHAEHSIRKNRETKNVKPNEDYVITDDDNHIYIVCDGVTRSLVNGQYPEPSPATLAAQVFARTVHQTLSNLLSAMLPIQALTQAVSIGNSAVAELNKNLIPKVDYLENDLAGTVSFIGIIVRDCFYYAYNGDCCAYAVAKEKIYKLTRSQTEKVAAHRVIVGSGPEATVIIRRDIRNAKDHPLGYGVFTGEGCAMDLVEYGKMELVGIEKIIIASDGLTPLFESYPEVFYESTSEQLIIAAEQFETKNNIRSDDKAVVILEICRLPSNTDISNNIMD